MGSLTGLPHVEVRQILLHDKDLAQVHTSREPSLASHEPVPYFDTTLCFFNVRFILFVYLMHNVALY